MNIYPVPAEKREAFDVLDILQDVDDDEFGEGASDGYLSFYDTRCDEIPAMTCDGMIAFLRGLGVEISGDDARWRLGYLVGAILAMGESRPDFAWTSADPPIQAVRCESEPTMR